MIYNVWYTCKERNLQVASENWRKEKGESMEEMTKEEMQRFLNREAEKGTTEYEALKALADILGIKFPELKENR